MTTKQITLIAALFGAMTTHAGVIVEQSGGTFTNGIPVLVGQSVTTPSGGPWYNIKFSFLKETQAGPVPVVNGTLYILSSPYLGLPGLLYGAPQIIAQYSGSNSDGYYFADSVVLQPNTTYWFYSNGYFDTEKLGIQGQGYSGGDFYMSFAGDEPYQLKLGSDASFRLSGLVVGEFNFPIDTGGNSVPEPATYATVGLILLLCTAARNHSR